MRRFPAPPPVPKSTSDLARLSLHQRINSLQTPRLCGVSRWRSFGFLGQLLQEQKTKNEFQPPPTTRHGTERCGADNFVFPALLISSLNFLEWTCAVEMSIRRARGERAIQDFGGAHGRRGARSNKVEQYGGAPLHQEEFAISTEEGERGGKKFHPQPGSQDRACNEARRKTL